TTRRGSGIAQPSVPRARCPECLVPGAPRVRAGPSHRHARRAAGDRGPWVSLPLRATIPEGNTVGQHADVDVGPSHRAPGLRARGLTTSRVLTLYQIRVSSPVATNTTAPSSNGSPTC